VSTELPAIRPNDYSCTTCGQPTSDPLDPATLLRNTLAELQMRQRGLALRTGLSIKHINQIAQGNAVLTPDVALRFERATGVPALEWMRAEAAYRDGLIRTRPRVWWSNRDGVLEELPGRDRPLRVLRVVTGLVLDELPADAVELVPSDSVP
jgi:plasmid maintenance system antidote protein VapI